MTLSELPAYLRDLAVRAGEAAIPASNGMSEAFDKEVKARLTARSHARGTRTPAPPGGPPAMESGRLAGSIQQVPATTPLVATSSVAPHMPPRDWVQEYGLEGITPAHAEFMVFYYGAPYRARVVNVPERSYMRTTVDLMAANGSLSAAAAGAFYTAMWG